MGLAVARQTAGPRRMLLWPAGLFRSDGRVRQEFRTSCAQRQATAILAAHFSASSCEGTSTTANPPRCSLLSGDGPSMTAPSVATTLASWPSPGARRPTRLHPWPSRPPRCAAFATSGRSSSGKVIAPSSNEIRCRVLPSLLVPAAPAATHPFYDNPCPGTHRRCHRLRVVQPPSSAALRVEDSPRNSGRRRRSWQPSSDRLLGVRGVAGRPRRRGRGAPARMATRGEVRATPIRVGRS